MAQVIASGQDSIEDCGTAYEPNPMRYPELHKEAQRIADAACRQINEVAPGITSAMPYKAQFILETVIAILQERV